MSAVYPINPISPETVTNPPVHALPEIQKQPDEITAAYPSHMKPSLILTRDMWAVSMVIENKPFSMHTLLLIETIQESGRVNFKAHLMGPGTLKDKKTTVINREDPKTCCSCWATVGKVDITSLPEVINPTRYRPQRETWLVSREKVQAMIDQIHNEKNQPELVDRPFHIFGEKSVFARERVDFDIQDEELLQMREQEPQKFKEMYDLYHRYQTLQASIQELEPPTPLKYPFMKILMDVFGKPCLGLIERGFEEEKPAKVIGGALAYVAVLPITLPLSLLVLAVDMPRALHEQKEFDKNEKIMKSIKNHVNKLKIVSQNCFNWARNKLNSIDVHIEEGSSERFAVIPTSYLPNQTKAKKK